MSTLVWMVAYYMFYAFYVVGSFILHGGFFWVVVAVVLGVAWVKYQGKAKTP